MNYYNSETLLEQQAEIEKLTAENQALAAQVEALKDCINKCTVDGVALLRLSAELKQLVAATPTACLAQIKAEAVKDFGGYYFVTYEMTPLYNAPTVRVEANQYAERIQQQREAKQQSDVK